MSTTNLIQFDIINNLEYFHKNFKNLLPSYLYGIRGGAQNIGLYCSQGVNYESKAHINPNQCVALEMGCNGVT